jgi:hypothetical protein
MCGTAHLPDYLGVGGEGHVRVRVLRVACEWSVWLPHATHHRPLPVSHMHTQRSIHSHTLHTTARKKRHGALGGANDLGYACECQT